MSRSSSPSSRLLATALRPDVAPMSAVLVVLLVSLGLRLMIPLLLARFVDDAIAHRPLSDLTGTAIALVAAAVLAEGLQLVVTWGSVVVSWRAGNRLRERLADHAVRLDMSWHGRHSPGQLIERIDGDVEALVVFFTNVVVNVVGNALLMLGILVIALTIDPWAGLVLTMSAIVGSAVLIRLRSAAVPAREEEREANAQLYGDLEERLGGLEDLRANGAGEYAVHRLHTNSARSWRTARRASLLGDGSYAMSAVTFATGSVATLAVGFVLLDRGAATIGAVIALFRYSELLRQPLERIAEQLSELQKALAGARRASRLLATEPVVRDGPLGADALPAGPLTVDFDAVSFRYAADAPDALCDVELHIPAGTHLGVVGRTGSGKTTLGRLVMRLWDVTDGAVRLGGIDVRELHVGAVRSRVAVVTQDVELFRASLRDNLTLFGARPSADDHLRAVLADVGLGPWLHALPEGLDSELAGSQGVSAGEAQLLAFARAFLAEPDLVVLDEASSRLDPVTEARIAGATRRLLKGRTAIIVAHRLATLDEVDDIVVIDRGRIVEHGPRLALAADHASRYAGLLRTAAGPILSEEQAG